MPNTKDILKLSPLIFFSETDILLIILLISLAAMLLFSGSIIIGLSLIFTASYMNPIMINPENSNIAIPPMQILSLMALYISICISIITYIYIMYPENIKNGLKIIDLSNLPHINEAISSFLHRFNDKHRYIQTLIYLPKNKKGDMFVFGNRGKYYIAIPLGLVYEFKNDPEKYKPLFLHEVAHIFNGDVSKTFITLSIWSFFVNYMKIYIPLILILIAISLHAGKYDDLIWYIASTIMISVVIYLSYNSILRIREFFADKRATLWDTSPNNIQYLLSNNYVPKPTERSGIHTYLKNLFEVHPTITRRIKMLSDNTPLFSPKIIVVFVESVVFISLSWLIFQSLGFILPSILSVSNGTLSINIMGQPINPYVTIVFPLIIVCAGSQAFRYNMLSLIYPLSPYLSVIWAFTTALVMTIGIDIASLISNGPIHLANYPNLESWLSFILHRSLTFFFPLLYLSYFSKKLVSHHFGDSIPKGIYIATLVSAYLLYIINSAIASNVYISMAWILLYFMLSEAVVRFITIKNSKCPYCGSIILEALHLDTVCPSCQRSLADWAKLVSTQEMSDVCGG
jgi:Zn-dependent protease with chaperone function